MKTHKTTLHQVVIGIYDFGWEQVELVLRSGQGGEFFACPTEGPRCARIKVGGDYDHWWEVVTVLVHETMELALFRLGCRLSQNGNMSNSHASYMFVASHEQFADACARSAEFMTKALPDLARKWKAWKKSKRRS